MFACMFLCLCITCTSGAMEARRASGSLALQVERVVRQHTDAGNIMGAPHGSRQCSCLLRHLSSPIREYFKNTDKLKEHLKTQCCHLSRSNYYWHLHLSPSRVQITLCMQKAFLSRTVRFSHEVYLLLNVCVNRQLSLRSLQVVPWSPKTLDSDKPDTIFSSTYT